jgi:hypothetical protein
MNKRQIAMCIMDENPEMPMADVCHIIAKDANMSYAQARAYYTWAVETNRAPGVIVHEKRGRKLGFKLNKKEDQSIQVNDPNTEETQEDFCSETYDNLNSVSTEKKYELDVVPQHSIAA